MQMTPRDIEREQYEIVFGLTGGELETEPWGDHPYWYEGTPDYWQPRDWTTRTYRTILSWGKPENPPEEGWTRVKVFRTSGEAECLCDADPACPICDGDGIVYIGDGYTEVVYVQDEEDDEEEDTDPV